MQIDHHRFCVIQRLSHAYECVMKAYVVILQNVTKFANTSSFISFIVPTLFIYFSNRDNIPYISQHKYL